METIKQELKKIQLITAPSKIQKTLQELIDKAEKPNTYIKMARSWNWVYFYLETNKYDPETKRTGFLGRKKLGKMEIRKYKNLDKETLRKLPLEDLKKLLVEY